MMPQPDWSPMDYDPLEPPHTGIEILGRGRGSRKSKTFIPSLEVSMHLNRIANWGSFLMEYFRRLHARHYTIEVEVKREDGSKVMEVRPHVLSDKQVRAEYPVVGLWENFHQGEVDHLASLKGFSVIRATGAQSTDRGRERGPDTSAGTDRRERREEERWR